MSVFIRKSVDALILESKDNSKQTLKRSMSLFSLFVLGVGGIIGAGLFSVTGLVAANYAGPSIIISFIFASLACLFSALCYAELSSTIPIAGSAYTYSYATLGELIAWVIGWDLCLEYAFGAATVSSSWSRYFVHFLSLQNIHIPDNLTYSMSDGGLINIPAIFISFVIMLILIRGNKESAWGNIVFVSIKLLVIAAFIFAGLHFFHWSNLTPFIPKNTGTFGHFGLSGIIRASGIIFFAYLGFDALSATAQEAKNPQINMPIAIIGSLLIVTLIYIAFSTVLLGVVPYQLLKSDGNDLAPVATAVSKMGVIDVQGNMHLSYPWLAHAILIGIIFGYISVLMIQFIGITRVFYSMSKDGLVPKFFGTLHKNFQTPAKNTFFFFVLVAILSSTLSQKVLGDMCSIGTLLAFILVCIGVLILRKRQPNLPRKFKTPFMPWVPLLGIGSSLLMMLYLEAETWIRLIAWLLLGLDCYLFYGIKNSKMRQSIEGQRVNNVHLVYYTALVSSIILIISGLYYQTVVGWQTSKFVLILTTIWSVGHIVLYTIKLVTQHNAVQNTKAHT
ncbi:MAG: amino acid permease [Phycisphaerales bacterium]|nr:amino acid permease [Phycisphaerales bacterium]